MTKKEVTKSKLGTYAVIMLLSAIIIIIIAAMADNREARFITELEATNQTNMTIQNEIVSLKDENYALKNEKESLSKQLEEISAENKIYNILSEGLSLLKSDKKAAKAKLSEIDEAALPENCKQIYETIKDIIVTD